MEDSEYIFDEFNEKERIERKIKEYYTERSFEFRNRLLSKNMKKPENVFDVMYDKEREVLLAKNKSNNTDLDKQSLHLRNHLLSKNLEKKTDLLSLSEKQREQLKYRNKINEDKNQLLSKSEDIRKSLIVKNTISNSNLLDSSSAIRKDLLSKNVVENKKIDNNRIREDLLSKNNSDDFNLQDYSKEVRESNVNRGGKNQEENTLLDESQDIRKDNLSKNVKNYSDLNKNSELIRRDLLSKNKDNNINLEEFFESVRKNLLSKNRESNFSLQEVSNAYRETLLSKNSNYNDEGGLSDLSEDVRKDLLSKNREKANNLEDSSRSIREDLLGKNNLNANDLETQFAEIRENLLSKNKQNNNSVSYDQIRNELLSKNIVKDVDLLQSSSVYRNNLVGKNKENSSSLLENSINLRNALLSKNLKNNLSFDSDSYREELLNKNIEKDSNLQRDSNSIREGLVSRNIPKESNLLEDSGAIRNTLLDKNIPNNSDLVSLGQGPREDLLSRNTPNDSDLTLLGELPRRSLLSKNVPNNTDLLVLGQNPRESLLSKNVPNNTDLLVLGQDPRESLLSKNVPNDSDLLLLGQDPREDLLSKNVPNDSDLLLLGQDFRENLLAKNVPVDTSLFSLGESTRESLLSKNVPDDIDLVSLGEIARGNNLSKNVSKNIDISALSEEFRDDLLSKNQESDTNLQSLSVGIRNEMLSRNEGGLLGSNLEGFGTSTFVGVSRVAVQGALYRNILESKNLNEDQLLQNSIRRDEINQIARDNNVENTINSLYRDEKLQGLFGIGKVDNQRIYSTAEDIKIADNTYRQKYTHGSVTDAIRTLNLSKNTFNLKNNYSAADLSESIEFLENINAEGFQSLIEKTIGNFSKNTQIETNTTPANIVEKNSGSYIKGDAEKILRPEEFEIGSAESMMAKTIPGNPFDSQDFRRGERGVRRIVNVIKNSSQGEGLDMRSNYDSQNSRQFVVGSNPDGSPKLSKQRFNVANPYAPQGAESLTLYFLNYSVPEGSRAKRALYFPPYVQSFGHNSQASWNETVFIGRPEPMYTYNYSRRTGNISFYVLTDFAQEVEISANYDTGGVNSYNFDDKRFTSLSPSQRQQQKESLLAEGIALEREIAEINNRINLASDSESANLEQDRKIKESQVRSISSKVWEIDRTQSGSFSEEGVNGRNVYSNVNRIEREDGYINTVPEDTQTRLDDMKKNLMFQPAYFSGDKVDYIERIEFLEKMTRPSRNSGPGFSFINPPICHMHLGDYFNHDIVVNDVSYDYTDVTWTLDGGKVQPMWTLVSISFDIIGEYRHGGGGPLLSDDVGGFFSDRRTTGEAKKTRAGTQISAAAQQSQGAENTVSNNQSGEFNNSGQAG